MCLWLLVFRRKSSGWCTFGLCAETRRSLTHMLPGGCWTSQPRARSRSSEELEGTHTRLKMEGSDCAHTIHCVTLSLKHDCTTLAVPYHWTRDWCHMVGCTCDCWHIVLHFCYRFVFSSSLCSRVCGKAAPFISNNDLKGIVQLDMLTQLSISGKAQKPA